MPEVVQSIAKQFCSTVLGSLGESEPVVIGPLWEAALLVVTHNEVRRLKGQSAKFIVHSIIAKSGHMKSEV